MFDLLVEAGVLLKRSLPQLWLTKSLEVVETK